MSSFLAQCLTALPVLSCRVIYPVICTCAAHAHTQVEYINLRGTSKDKPAVCKYTGNKYYSDPHTWMAH